jgi:polyphosphate kinase 2
METPSPDDPTAKPLVLTVNGKTREFDINDPKLPDWIDKEALESGGYPYKHKLDDKEYEDTLEKLQIELVKAQKWLLATGNRCLSLFEGRDAAGKGGTIFVIRQYMNPRSARNVALPKPTETERGQWYFQRYVDNFPTSAEFVTFDRSWYNRAGVEPVMGFCTPEQHKSFLAHTPRFEELIVEDGIFFFKFWLDIGQEMQLKRFHDRRHSELTNWKFSPIDVASMTRWDDYSRMRDLMVKKTHTPNAPWTIIRSNDKRRARLAAIRKILRGLPYDGKKENLVSETDPLIIGEGPNFL